MRTDRRNAHRKSVIIAILSVLLALLIPVCALLARDYYLEATAEPEQVSAPSVPPPASSKAPPEESSSSEPEPEDPVGGPVPESEPVGQEYFDDAVFFGDSITNGISVYALMSNAEVIAVTGANPMSALEKPNFTPPGGTERVTMADALKGAKAGKIYIQLGANWVGERSGIDKETFIRHYRTLLERIREDHPRAVVYIQSMFPVSKDYSTNENGKNTYGLTGELIRAYNAALEELAAEMNLWYLDLYDVFCDEEGYLPAEVTPDGMHLNPQYYQKWFDYLSAHAVPAQPGEEDGEDTTGSAASDGDGADAGASSPPDSASSESREESASGGPQGASLAAS